MTSWLFPMRCGFVFFKRRFHFDKIEKTLSYWQKSLLDALQYLWQKSLLKSLLNAFRYLLKWYITCHLLVMHVFLQKQGFNQLPLSLKCRCLHLNCMPIVLNQKGCSAHPKADIAWLISYATLLYSKSMAPPLKYNFHIADGQGKKKNKPHSTYWK